MRIIKLQIENFKKLRAVEITPDGNIVTISGSNEAGKSSLINAIWMALQNKFASRETPNPVTYGETHGRIVLDVGEYIITRKFTNDKTSLEVKRADGSIIPSPQKFLDGLVGILTLDPWSFIRKDEQKQREIIADVLFKITDGRFNLSEYDAKHQAAYEERTNLNREKKRLEGTLTSIRPPSQQDPSEEISLLSLTELLNKSIERDKNLEEIKILQERIKILEQRNTEIGELDSNKIRNEISSLEQRNSRAREVQSYQRVRRELNKIEEELIVLNNKIELNKIEKSEALEKSPLPVNNLILTENGLQLRNDNGTVVPFSQGSTAQRFKVALAIAMAANPTLRVIRIEDGSLLDSKSWEVIRELAESGDWQVWIEEVADTKDGSRGFFIENGTLV